MGLDGTTIAAILTGILALTGAIATAWMSGLNENRKEARKNRKQLSRYSVPLLIASWDLANWLFDILDDDNFSPARCRAYGNGWTSQFSSYLFGQYFAGVHIIREMTQFFAGLGGDGSQELKKLLWKIQDEFLSMHYDGPENIGMRWVEYNILHVQEAMTVPDGVDGGLRAMQWREFKDNYALKDPGNDKDSSMELSKVFGWYEEQLQQIIYRRFKYLYSAETEALPTWKHYDEACKIIQEDEKQIMRERDEDPAKATLVVVTDHRIRRIQHLLVDLVKLLDEVSNMKFNRPVRRCRMEVDRRAIGHKTAVVYGATVPGQTTFRIPCDCNDYDGCNKDRVDFEHRALTSKGWGGLSKK
ncbi:hypothetical protein QBC39DRAFT_276138, partial [Podospora conica]